MQTQLQITRLINMPGHASVQVGGGNGSASTFSPKLRPAHSRWNARLPPEAQWTFEKLSPETRQADLVEPLHEAAFGRLLDDSSPQDKARLRSLRMPHALNALNILPIPGLGTHLSNAEAQKYIEFVVGGVPYTD